MVKIKKETFSKILKLYTLQPWLANNDKELALLDILDECPDASTQELIFELLANFQYMDANVFGKYQNQVADFIVNNSKFILNQTQIVATAYDKEADSSQAILQALKLKLANRGWGTVQTINSIGQCIKAYNKKKLNQIILVDEFVGSGKTIASRINYIRKNIGGEIEIKCCFIAGIEFGLQKIEDECNVDIFCPLRLNRGISDVLNSDLTDFYLNSMTELEKKDCYRIDEEKLQIYSLGYNKAEALYSAEEVGGNTPNSVFPIFWWPVDKKGTITKRILSRYEKGLYENLGI